MPALPPRLPSALAACGHALLILLCLLLVLGVLVPFTPIMPTTGLDPSWMWGLGEAAAQHRVFGRELIFTYGPYVSVWTRWYFPGSDGFVMTASLLLAACHMLLLALLARGAELRWPLLYVVVLAGLDIGRDAQFLAYLPLLALYGFRLLTGPVITRGGQLVLALGCLPLGLLPLIKCSFLVPGVALTGLLAVLAWRAAQRRLLAALLLVPPLGLIGFWLLAGQPLAALPDYFRNTLPIIGGYTEAMALPLGNGKQALIFYAFGSTLLLRFILHSGAADRVARWLLAGFIGFLLFCAYKFGFVRYDRHALTAAGLLLILPTLLRLELRQGPLLPALVLAVMTWWGLDGAFNPSSTHSVYVLLRNTLSDTRNGLHNRLQAPQALPGAYAQALATVHAQFPLPDWQGTADIYSWRQDLLLASGLHWSPRPVLQSYSAYTAPLLKANADHLRGAQAPDHIAFAMQPIDGRLPALEEGASWPLLMSRYRASGFAGDFAWLDRLPGPPPPEPVWQPVRSGLAQLGEGVSVPAHPAGEPLYLRIDLQPTLPGRLLAFAYKPPILTLTLHLADGEEVSTRVVSGMMRTAFLISPALFSSREFLLEAGGQNKLLAGQEVAWLRLSPEYGGRLLWRQQFHIEFGRLPQPPMSTPPIGTLLDTAGPAPASVAVPGHCGSYWAELNGHAGTQPVPVAGLLDMRAVLEAGPDGSFPEQVFFTLRSKDGSLRYAPGRALPDQYIDTTNLLDPGQRVVSYRAMVDISTLSPPQSLQLGLARRDGQLLTQCTEAAPMAHVALPPRGIYVEAHR